MESLPVTVIGSQAAQRSYRQKRLFNYDVVNRVDGLEGMALVYIPGVKLESIEEATFSGFSSSQSKHTYNILRSLSA